MATKTYAERVNIIKYVKLADRWRFAPVVKRPNGNIHWDYVLIDGTAQQHLEGKYFIEWREDGARRRKSVMLERAGSRRSRLPSLAGRWSSHAGRRTSAWRGFA